jgi:peptidoglycan/xylan/chitin deacetylase (PgdA/CDA1 family)
VRHARLFGVLLFLISSTSTAAAKRPPKRAKAASPAHARAPAEPAKPAEVLFTFDDGPHQKFTPKVLAELEKHKVHAIFFVNGWHFEKDVKARAVLRDEIAQGHYVGNHTYSHRILCKNMNLAPTEIDKNEDLIDQALGYRPTLLRTPYGQHCPALVKLVKARGYDQIAWNIDAQEWKPGTHGDKVASFIINQIAHAHGRTIVLLHDTHAVTLDALPKILEWLDKHPNIKVLEPRVLLKPGAPVPKLAATGQLR